MIRPHRPFATTMDTKGSEETLYPPIGTGNVTPTAGLTAQKNGGGEVLGQVVKTRLSSVSNKFHVNCHH